MLRLPTTVIVDAQPKPVQWTGDATAPRGVRRSPGRASPRWPAARGGPTPHGRAAAPPGTLIFNGATDRRDWRAPAGAGPERRSPPDGQRRTCQRGRATAEQLHSLACLTESKSCVAEQHFSLQDNTSHGPRSRPRRPGQLSRHDLCAPDQPDRLTRGKPPLIDIPTTTDEPPRSHQAIRSPAIEQPTVHRTRHRVQHANPRRNYGSDH